MLEYVATTDNDLLTKGMHGLRLKYLVKGWNSILTIDSMNARLEKGFVEQSKSRFAPVSTSTLELVAPRVLEPVADVIALESSSHEPLVEDPVVESTW